MIAVWLLLVLLTAGATPVLARSPAAVSEFRRGHPCPATGTTRGACPGWVVDHLIPLSVYGADRPDNMQWQTVADAKRKDKLEYEAYHARMRAEKMLCPAPASHGGKR